MNCYECRGASTPPRTAEAVCSLCGVGLCDRHLVLETQELHRYVGMGKSTPDLPARRVVCPVCEKAEHSG